MIILTCVMVSLLFVSKRYVCFCKGEIDAGKIERLKNRKRLLEGANYQCVQKEIAKEGS